MEGSELGWYDFTKKTSICTYEIRVGKVVTFYVNVGLLIQESEFLKEKIQHERDFYNVGYIELPADNPEDFCLFLQLTQGNIDGSYHRKITDKYLLKMIELGYLFTARNIQASCYEFMQFGLDIENVSTEYVLQLLLQLNNCYLGHDLFRRPFEQLQKLDRRADLRVLQTSAKDENVRLLASTLSKNPLFGWPVKKCSSCYSCKDLPRNVSTFCSRQLKEHFNQIFLCDDDTDKIIYPFTDYRSHHPILRRYKK